MLADSSRGRVRQALAELCAGAQGQQITWQDICEWFEAGYPGLAAKVTPKELAELCPISLFGMPWQIEGWRRDAETQRQRIEREARPRFTYLIDRPA